VVDLDEPERLIPFLRRTPDPCIQLVRMTTLKRVRSGTPEGTQFVDIASFEAGLSTDAAPSLRERIARANHDTLKRMGVEEFSARIGDILHDRDMAYASLEALDLRGEPDA
jgi:hypothetical protein